MQSQFHNPVKKEVSFALVLDTCSLRADASARSAVLRGIKDLIGANKLPVTVKIPNIVLDEMIRFHWKSDEQDVLEFNRSIEHVRNNFDRLQRRKLISGEGSLLDAKLLNSLTAVRTSKEERVINTRNYIRETLGTEIEFLPYPSVSHQEIVQRLFEERRPFKKTEGGHKNDSKAAETRDSGYRDSLVWLTVCELVRRDVNSEIIFVSSNTHEFAEKRAGAKSDDVDQLHGDLVDDLDAAEQSRLHYFSKLEHARLFLADRVASENLSSTVLSLTTKDSSGCSSVQTPKASDNSVDMHSLRLLAESEEVHDELFESLLLRLEEFDEHETNQWFFVRSTVAGFVLTRFDERVTPIGEDGSEFICEAEYFGKICLMYYHNNREHLLDRTEFRGVRISARLILDLQNKRVSNLSCISVDDEPLIDCFLRAVNNGEGWSVRIVEPRDLALRSEEQTFENYDAFVTAMVTIGAEADSLNERESIGVLNAFSVSSTADVLLAKYGLLSADW